MPPLVQKKYKCLSVDEPGSVYISFPEPKFWLYAFIFSPCFSMLFSFFFPLPCWLGFLITV